MSSIKYLVRTRKNPIDKTSKYYATSAPQDLVTEEEIMTQIAQKSTISRADILAVLSALREEIRYNLMNGRKVKLNDLGTFRTSIRCMGAQTEQALTTANIRSCRVVFTPSRAIMMAIRPGSGVSFSNAEAKPAAVPVPPHEGGLG